jgi:hypothetical protein
VGLDASSLLSYKMVYTGCVAIQPLLREKGDLLSLFFFGKWRDIHDTPILVLLVYFAIRLASTA